MAIISTDYFKIDGKSSNEIGIYTDTPPTPAMSERRYIEYEAIDYGENQAYPDDFYGDVEVTISCFTFERYDTRKLYALLNGGKRLETSAFADFYYKIKKVYPPQITYAGKGKTQFDLTFVCSPFRYNVDNPEIAISSGGTVSNNGTMYSRPVYKMKMQGDARLVVNDDILYFYDMPAGEIIVDCEKMLVYDANMNVLNSKTKGFFPFLSSDGANVIVYDGGISSLKVIKNERWI